MSDNAYARTLGTTLHPQAVGWVSDTPHLVLGSRIGPLAESRVIRPGNPDVDPCDGLFGDAGYPKSWVSLPEPIPLSAPHASALLLSDYRVRRDPAEGVSRAACLTIRCSAMQGRRLGVSGWIECDGQMVFSSTDDAPVFYNRLLDGLRAVARSLHRESDSRLTEGSGWQPMDDTLSWAVYDPDGFDCLKSVLRPRLNNSRLTEISADQPLQLRF